jgi:hypothetical protein
VSTNDEMKGMSDHYPRRDDQVAAWIKQRRDDAGDRTKAWALDDLLDEYRLAADTGQSLENMVNGEEEHSFPKTPKKKRKKP